MGALGFNLSFPLQKMSFTYDVSATCPTCYKVFNSSNNARGNQNSMEQHQQVHKPKVHSCPLCGVQKFRSPANAVQHVEVGACPNCPGDQAHAISPAPA